MNPLRMRWTFWKKRRFLRRLRMQRFTHLGVHLDVHLSLQLCVQRGHRHATQRCL